MYFCLPFEYIRSVASFEDEYRYHAKVIS